jgi:hypothetical protein
LSLSSDFLVSKFAFKWVNLYRYAAMDHLLECVDVFLAVRLPRAKRQSPAQALGSAAALSRSLSLNLQGEGGAGSGSGRATSPQLGQSRSVSMFVAAPTAAGSLSSGGAVQVMNKVYP